MPGRKKRDDETYGLRDSEALKLYAEGKATLESREQWNAATAAVLKSAAEWRQEAGEISREISRMTRSRDGGDAGTTPTRLRAMIKNRALCEAEMRKNLDDLLLLPRLPRGRPASGEDDEQEDTADDAWAAFDEDDGGGGP